MTVRYTLVGSPGAGDRTAPGTPTGSSGALLSSAPRDPRISPSVATLIDLSWEASVRRVCGEIAGESRRA